MLPRTLAPLLALLFFTAAAKPPAVIVRFFGEAKQQDTEKFASPVLMKYPPRAAYIERVPIISERNIKAIYPYPAGDNTYGCVFKLDDSGRLGLEVASTERRGSSLVVFMGGPKSPRQITDMVVDRPVRDGIITIPRGLTEADVALLRKEFKRVLKPGGDAKPAASPATTMPRPF